MTKKANTSQAVTAPNTEKTENNENKPVNLGGRPMKYDTAEKLSEAIDDYFRQCKLNDKPYIWHDLLNYLKITDDTICRYQNNTEDKYPGYSEVVKRAVNEFSTFWQSYALEHPNLQSFCIFQLKQVHNGGLTDKQQIEQKIEFDLKLNGQTM